MTRGPLITTLSAFVLVSLCSFPTLAQSTAKPRPPSRSEASRQEKRKPRATHKAVPRPTPPRRQLPKPPLRSQPRLTPPPPTYRYPFTPFVDFDFTYRFPYGVVPYGRYGYPEYPYRFVFPPPGCVVAETGAVGYLRIEIPQRDAAVFADGFYLGIVEDIINARTGVLPLTPGPHHLELYAPGFETSAFDVNVEPDRTIVYRSPMRAAGSPAVPHQ